MTSMDIGDIALTILLVGIVGVLLCALWNAIFDPGDDGRGT